MAPAQTSSRCRNTLESAFHERFQKFEGQVRCGKSEYRQRDFGFAAHSVDIAQRIRCGYRSKTPGIVDDRCKKIESLNHVATVAKIPEAGVIHRLGSNSQ